MLVMPRMAPPPQPIAQPSPTIAPASQADDPSTRPSDAPPPGWREAAPRPLASPVDYDDVAADPASHGGFVPGPSGGPAFPFPAPCAELRFAPRNATFAAPPR